MERIRADFSKAAYVAPEAHRWQISPAAGVERVLFDRVGDEVAMATSLVRYAPGAEFAAHRHERGEEFFVVEGVFEDEYGSYPMGSYVRNPPGSEHSPRSSAGCVLFVKLRQFLTDDTAQVVVDTTRLPVASPGEVLVHPLHRFDTEQVDLVDGAAATRHSMAAVEVPRELFVLSGTIGVPDHRLKRGAWLRLPAGSAATLQFEHAGRVLVRTRPVVTDA